MFSIKDIKHILTVLLLVLIIFFPAVILILLNFINSNN